MTTSVLKYNTYKEIIPRKRGSLLMSGSKSNVLSFDDTLMAGLIKISFVLIIALVGVYIAEKSSMVFSQRAVYTQEKKASLIEKEVSNLEITTTQLSATHNLTEVAIGEKMVIPSEVSYLNVDGGSVALIK